MDWLLAHLYHSSQLPPQARTAPMQVLALGLSRSGTESLRNALLTLGYDHTYHGYDAPGHARDLEHWHLLAQKKWANTTGDVLLTTADFDAILGHCAAVTDMPCAAFALELIAAYPDAKVILNTRRDPDAWYRSYRATFGQLGTNRFKSWFCPEWFWLRKTFENPFYRYFYDDFAATGKWVYREHCAKIRGSLVEEKERLLEWVVEDGWEPLCKFLGKEVPDVDFPKGNMPAEFLEKSASVLRESDRKAYRNMAMVAAGFVGFFALSSIAIVRWSRFELT